MAVLNNPYTGDDLPSDDEYACPCCKDKGMYINHRGIDTACPCQGEDDG